MIEDRLEAVERSLNGPMRELFTLRNYSSLTDDARADLAWCCKELARIQFLVKKAKYGCDDEEKQYQSYIEQEKP